MYVYEMTWIFGLSTCYPINTNVYTLQADAYENEEWLEAEDVYGSLANKLWLNE